MSSKVTEQLTITPNRWYAWQMMPGYLGVYEPYYSPIYIRSFKPLKSGRGTFKLEFLNVGYASGAQEFKVRLRTIKRCYEYLVAEYDEQGSDRTVIISEISSNWVRQHASGILVDSSTIMTDAADIQGLLNERFLLIKRTC